MPDKNSTLGSEAFEKGLGISLKAFEQALDEAGEGLSAGWAKVVGLGFELANGARDGTEGLGDAMKSAGQAALTEGAGAVAGAGLAKGAFKSPAAQFGGKLAGGVLGALGYEKLANHITGGKSLKETIDGIEVSAIVGNEDPPNAADVLKALDAGYTAQQLEKLAREGRLGEFLDRTKGRYDPFEDSLNTELSKHKNTPNDSIPGYHSSPSPKVENPKSDYWEKYSEDKKKMGDGGKKAAADENAANESKKVTSKPDPRTEAREEKREQKEASDAAKEKEKHDNHIKEKNYDREHPIVLDLDGDGVQITEISRSNVFMDSANDGLLHRTAWAAAGNGVLFFDANLDGQISEKREYVFTEWDPTATSDLEALRAAFDSNGDGKLTSADAAFSQFKVMVSNADGSLTPKTLAELGITEINLTGDATHIVLPDGSVITGQTTYKKSDGSTGTVADTALVAEADGNRVTQTVSTDGSGNRVVVSKSYDASGNLAYAITSTNNSIPKRHAVDFNCGVLTEFSL